MKKWFNIFIYISLAFLIYALFRADYLIVPEIHSVSKIILSLFLVFVGFLSDAFIWGRALRKFGYHVVSTRSAIISMGLSIFGKYIPGKIWVIVGRATFIKNKYNLSLNDTAAISLNAQFLVLWTGLICGAAGLLFTGNKDYWAQIVLIMCFGLSLILFTSFFHSLATKILRIFVKKSIEIPRLKFTEVLQLIPWFFLPWLFWGAGFYLLADGLTPFDVAPLSGLGFALAATFGVLAIVVPGGLGVREGVLSGFLIMTGVEPPYAITISLASRFWYLAGEFFIFIIAGVLNRLKSDK